MGHALARKLVAVEAISGSTGRHFLAGLDAALHTGLPFGWIVNPAAGTWILVPAIGQAEAAIDPAGGNQCWSRWNYFCHCHSVTRSARIAIAVF